LALKHREIQKKAGGGLEIENPGLFKTKRKNVSCGNLVKGSEGQL